MLRGAELDARLRRRAAPVPLLVVRVAAVERVAWKHGRDAAQRLERRAEATFAELTARVLRSGDWAAHDARAATFVAALSARPRARSAAPSALDVRATLARLARGMEAALASGVAAGWTVHRGRAESDDRETLLARALRAGDEERTRYGFFAALGHELRTPLAAVRGYLETALEEPDDALRRRFLGIAHRETLRVCRMVEGMFEISLLDLHPEAASRRTASLHAVVSGSLRACASAARARGVMLHAPSAPDAVLAGGEDQLIVALANVIGNAVKHGRAGGSVAVGVHVGRDSASITVDDDGPGVPARDRARIFLFGERAGAAATGTGIGLATARLLLDRAGGRIRVAASPRGGARFVLTVPRAARPRRGRAG